MLQLVIPSKQGRVTVAVFSNLYSSSVASCLYSFFSRLFHVWTWKSQLLWKLIRSVGLALSSRQIFTYLDVAVDVCVCLCVFVCFPTRKGDGITRTLSKTIQTAADRPLESMFGGISFALWYFLFSMMRLLIFAPPPPPTPHPSFPRSSPQISLVSGVITVDLIECCHISAVNGLRVEETEVKGFLKGQLTHQGCLHPPALPTHTS